MSNPSTPSEGKRAETFVMDRAWLKREAREALKTYFAPFSGVYAAATGRAWDDRNS